MWCATKSSWWEFCSKKRYTKLDSDIAVILRRVENCRILSGLLETDTTVHVRAIADITTAFTRGAEMFWCLHHALQTGAQWVLPWEHIADDVDSCWL